MLNASRCSLLSRSLPHYQEATLTFWENTSLELHNVLDDFSTAHLHQYKVKSDVADEENCEEDKIPSTDSDDDDPENSRQLLLDLAPTEDVQTLLTDQILTKDSSDTQDSSGDFNTSYQNVDSFEQLKELLKKESRQPEASLAATLQPGSDQDLIKYLMNTSTAAAETSTDTVATSMASLSTTSVTSGATVPVTSCMSPLSHTSPKSTTVDSHQPKHQDNWDELFAELDPLSNEKV